MSAKLNSLYEKLGYIFNKKSLIDAALTHRSATGNEKASSKNNERLEFIGDSIVNFIIAEALFLKYKKAKEGELSRMRSHLVKGETLAELAKELSIGDFLRLGPGELKSGGKRRASILADAMEAIIAAIYLDSNLETCRERVLDWFKERIDGTSLGANMKDPKTQLQEWLQSKKHDLPTYRISKIQGDAHKQMFFVKCTVEILSLTSEGQGTSRRKAEQDAAEKLLEQLNKRKK